MNGLKAYPKADIYKRFLALFFDLICAGLVSIIPVIGGIAGALYMVFRDGLEWDFIKHRSFGKKIMKLKVAVLEGNKTTPDLELSFKRNWLLALPSALTIIPVMGWILAVPLNIAILLTEGIKVINDSNGRRFGDEFAKTQVVEESVNIG